MPGPAPKDPKLRQRRNKSATRAILPAEASPRTVMPSLPRGTKWHPMTKKWWLDVWSSPMATEYLIADAHALMRLAILINLFWQNPDAKLSGEIRKIEQSFGLTPLDRRRLEWQIEQTETAKDKRDRRRSTEAIIISADDPREILK